MEFWKEQHEHNESVNPSKVNQNLTVWNVSMRLKSIEVAKSMVIIEESLGFMIPEKKTTDLIKEGGYANFDEMENDLFPKLENLYISGDLSQKEKEKVV